MTSTTYNIACIGECMVEIALLRDQASTAKVGFGGDTLNTAIYLARLAENSDIRAHYVTLLGDDPFSHQMRNAWSSEGVGCDLVEHLPGREAGLYSISVDAHGERSFNYWRSHAPVREIFEGEAGLKRLDELRQMEAIFFSGITLAILFEESCDRLLDLCAEMKRAGKTVIFDSNYRPRLWQGRDPSSPYEKAFQASTLILPSYEDLSDVFGSTEPASKERLEKYELPEIVLKNGGNSVDLFQVGQWQNIELNQIELPIDTTAAGDSFNAGYIHARLTGAPVLEAIHQAHKLACRVINFPGAIIPKSEMPIKE
ncbi:sugar kinase [Curvivirga sp.]|uniref:sugar kinase n=1 Tax=Curvivirga sp. TaxID=2856848 RepID=UPI003B58D4B9